MYNAMIG